jgi:hypothetical protein
VRFANKIRFRRALVRCTSDEYVIVRALSQAEIDSLGEPLPENRSQLALLEQQLSEAAAAEGKTRPGSVQCYDEVIVEGRDLESKAR